MATGKRFKVVSKAVILFLFTATFGTPMSAQKNEIPGGKLLAGLLDIQHIQQRLNYRAAWHNIPDYHNRTAWLMVPPSLQTQWVQAGEVALSQSWQVVPVTTYLEYEKSGSRQAMEQLSGQNIERLKKLVLAELIEGKQRFIPEILNGLFYFCEMTTWSASAHLYLQKNNTGIPDNTDPTIDIAGSNLAVLIAWTLHFFGKELDAISPVITRRINREIRTRILDPYYSRTDFWWMGYNKNYKPNNWTIWCNYNVLQCMLLLEKDSVRLLQGIAKCIETTDLFLDVYTDDGVCEEGPSYWNRAAGYLQPFLEIITAILGNGEQVWQHPKIRAMGSYLMHMHIAGDYFFNYSDATARLKPDPGIVFRYGKRTNNPALMELAVFFAEKQGWLTHHIQHDYLQVLLQNVFECKEIIDYGKVTITGRSKWLPQGEIAIMRQHEGSSGGWFVGVKAAHNGWSHGHIDAGSGVVFYNDIPLFIDVGRETYTRQSFGSERYKNWLIQSQYHNLPVINNQGQLHGAQYRAILSRFDSSADKVRFTSYLQQAYPPEAYVTSWQRTYTLHRKGEVWIEDKAELSEISGNTSLHFISSQKPFVAAGKIWFQPDSIQLFELQYNTREMEVQVEERPITDPVTLQSWPAVLYRIIFTWRKPQKKLYHRLIIQRNTL
jgi:hypothetical protein